MNEAPNDAPQRTTPNPVRHDCRRETYKAGWAIMDFDFLSAGTATVEAFGLKRRAPKQPLQQAYFLPSEEIVITMPDGVVLYEISKITYYRDPYDMYHAELRYIQHLTGLRIFGQRNDEQRARQLEWSRQHYSKPSQQ